MDCVRNLKANYQIGESMTTMRTTIRIDHDEDDKDMLGLIGWLKSKKYKTSHLKGVIQQRKLNG